MDNQALAKLFLQHLELKGFTSRTIETYRGKLNRFYDFLATKQKMIPELVTDNIEEYRMALFYQEYKGKPLSLETQTLQLTVCGRSFLNF